MPPVFLRDDYSSCLAQNAQYCTVEFDLLSNDSNPLYQMILEYSAFTPAHFNYSRLQYGLCITHTCKDYLQETTQDRSLVLEACLNGSFHKNYGLGVKVTEYACNDVSKTYLAVNIWDVIITCLCLSILMLNVVASLRQFHTPRDNKFLSCFSIRRNWAMLTRPVNSENKTETNFEPINGGRTITAFIMIFGHAYLPFYFGCKNTRDMEEGYSWLKYIAPGSVMVQTFFVMTGFLTAVALQWYERTNPVTPRVVCKGIFYRWLRWIMSMAFMLGVIATWLRFVGSGPNWQLLKSMIVKQAADCKRDWWRVMLMINNYNDNSRCMPDAWFVQADMQLTAVSLMLCLLKGRRRALALMLLLLGGIVSSAVTTYLMDLDGHIIVAPDVTREVFLWDATSNYVYRLGHTNSPSFVIGLAAGFQLQRIKEYNMQKYAISRIMFWSLVPPLLFMIFSGSTLYSEDWPKPLLYRMWWAALHRTVYGLIIALILTGLVLRIDQFASDFFSWRGWLVPSRLSYCVYLLNFTIIRLISGLSTTLLTFSVTNVILAVISVIVLSYLVAVPLWLLVEAPAGNLVKLVANPRAETKQE